MKTILSILTLFCVLNTYAAIDKSTRDKSNITEQKTTLPTVTYQHIEIPFDSNATGITYPVHIFVPNNYERTTKLYPVIYTTDGQWYGKNFVIMIEEQKKEVIYIAIEEGPDNRRNIDYVIPGLQQYFKFLTQELIPTLEKNLRVDPSKRILMGTSLGGLFVNAAMLLEKPETRLFSTYLSFDASMSLNKKAFSFLLKERFNSSSLLPVKLILTTATKQGNKKAVRTFQRKLEKTGFKGLSVSRIDIPVTHPQVGTSSFKRIIPLIFNE